MPQRLPTPKSHTARMRTWASSSGEWLDDLLQSNGSTILMLSAQVCSTILSTTGRILRTGDNVHSQGMETSVILFFMMAITMTLSWIYIFLASVADGPCGSLEARGLLLTRALAGFFGVWGFYASLRYLALAEATIINFIAPMLAILMLGLFPGERCSVAQLVAGVVSIAGAVCVLQPWNAHLQSTLTERALAAGAASVGVLGGAVAYVAMLRLGKRAHPIVTVMWFATTCTALNGAILLLRRDAPILPSTRTQWVLIGVLGVVGFAMHWLLTASMMWGDDSKQALHVVYTQILFTMMADKLVWDVSPDVWKFAGGFIILCSAIYVTSTRPAGQYVQVESIDLESEDVEMALSKDMDEAARGTGYDAL